MNKKSTETRGRPKPTLSEAVFLPKVTQTMCQPCIGHSANSSLDRHLQRPEVAHERTTSTN
jgi:hypothetical protein